MNKNSLKQIFWPYSELSKGELFYLECPNELLNKKWYIAVENISLFDHVRFQTYMIDKNKFSDVTFGKNQSDDSKVKVYVLPMEYR